jgi:hypothetical protein
VDVASVGLRRTPADGEPEAETASIGALLGEWTEQRFDFSRRQPAALVFDVEENAICRRAGRQRHTAAGTRELERILQEIRDRGGEERAVALDSQRAIEQSDAKVGTSCLRLHQGPDLDFLDKFGDGDAFYVLQARVETHVGERAVDEIAKAHQASAVDERRATAGGDPAARNGLEGKHRGVEEVPQLVREHSQALGSAVTQRALPLSGKLRDRLGDGVVETQIERLKLRCRNPRVLIRCQFGDGLADITVVVNDLRDAEAHAKQMIPMLPRTLSDLLVIDRVARLCQAQRRDELVHEDRNPTHELFFVGLRRRSRCNSSPRAIEDGTSVPSDEIGEHPTIVRSKPKVGKR